MECLNFNIAFCDEVENYLTCQITNVLDIIDQKLSKTVGNLSILAQNVNLEIKTQAVFSSSKRSLKNGTASVKPKIAKIRSSKQPTALNPGNAPARIQPDVQQDPNDLIGTLQSLDSGEKMFSCKLCGLQAKWKANVKGHVIRRHMQSLKETFACSMCDGKSFTSKQNLKLHYMKSHNMNEKVANAAIDV